MTPRTLLTATRGSYNDPAAEAEPVLVEHDEQTVTLTLDDGEELTFDRGELRAALDARDVRGLAA